MSPPKPIAWRRRASVPKRSGPILSREACMQLLSALSIPDRRIQSLTLELAAGKVATVVVRRVLTRGEMAVATTLASRIDGLEVATLDVCPRCGSDDLLEITDLASTGRRFCCTRCRAVLFLMPSVCPLDR